MRIQLDPLFRNIGMHTRYTAGNIALLVIGLLLCVFDFSYIGLILATVPTPDAGWQRIGVDCFALVVVLAALAVLVGFRWPKIASTALWTLTFFYFVLAVAVRMFAVMVIPAAILAIASVVVGMVEHFSGRPAEIAGENGR